MFSEIILQKQNCILLGLLLNNIKMHFLQKVAPSVGFKDKNVKKNHYSISEKS